LRGFNNFSVLAQARELLGRLHLARFRVSRRELAHAPDARLEIRVEDIERGVSINSAIENLVPRVPRLDVSTERNPADPFRLEDFGRELAIVFLAVPGRKVTESGPTIDDLKPGEDRIFRRVGADDREINAFAFFRFRR